MSESGQFDRVASIARRPIMVEVDGVSVACADGDTVLTAIISHFRRLRNNEFDGSPRAGFCLMGACQDCWIWRADGHPIRACSTLVADGMALVTTNPFLRNPGL